jgi:hypothetical protein
MDHSYLVRLARIHGFTLGVSAGSRVSQDDARLAGSGNDRRTD